MESITAQCKPFENQFYGKIIDTHIHLNDLRKTKHLISYGQQYGISRWLAISSLKTKHAVNLMYDEMFKYNLFLNMKNIASATSTDENIKDILDEIEVAYAEDFAALKMWMPPRFKKRFNVETSQYINNEALYPVFQLIEDLEFAVIWHIADPDKWYNTVYSDSQYYGTKADHLSQIEKVAEKFNKLKIIIPHFGGNPENLEELSNLLSRRSNIYIDTSGTKWISRELSKHPEKAKQFIEKYDRRIFFGSDLVLGYEKPDIETYYRTRYWVQQALLSSDKEWQSPIPDPDSEKTLTIKGLNLTESSLRRIYHENAEKMFNF